MLSEEERERLAFGCTDASVRLLGGLFRRYGRPDEAGLLVTLPPIRDRATSARARAVVLNLFRHERSPSRLQATLLSTATFLTRLEGDPTIGQAALFAVMASRHHSGDDRFFDALMAPLMVTA